MNSIELNQIEMNAVKTNRSEESLTRVWINSLKEFQFFEVPAWIHRQLYVRPESGHPSGSPPSER